MVSSVKCRYHSVKSGEMVLFPRAVGDSDVGHQLQLWKLPHNIASTNDVRLISVCPISQ